MDKRKRRQFSEESDSDEEPAANLAFTTELDEMEEDLAALVMQGGQSGAIQRFEDKMRRKAEEKTLPKVKFPSIYAEAAATVPELERELA